MHSYLTHSVLKSQCFKQFFYNVFLSNNDYSKYLLFQIQRNTCTKEAIDFTICQDTKKAFKVSQVGFIIFIKYKIKHKQTISTLKMYIPKVPKSIEVNYKQVKPC